MSHLPKHGRPHNRQLAAIALVCLSIQIQQVHSSLKPLIFHPPHLHRTNNLRYGQTACVSVTGRHVIIGANGFQNHKGAIYLYSLAEPDANRLENGRRKRIKPSGTHPAEERWKE